MSGRILIVNDTRDAGYPYAPFLRNLEAETIFNVTNFLLQPDKYDLVVFTGGSDVQPELYGDTSPNGVCYTNPKRDREEVRIFNQARKYNVPMFGICRGFQFINVMCGGKLIHDLAGHQSGHEVSASDGESFDVNSLHHQACILPMNAELLAWSTTKQSKTYIGDEDKDWNYLGPEVECAYYPDYRAAGVQWHPEALKGTSRGRTWPYLLARDLYQRLDVKAMRKMYYINRPRVNYVEVY